MKKPEFDIYQIADVSTKYITKEDGSLIGRPDAPGHIACIDPVDAESGSPGVPIRPKTSEEPSAEWPSRLVMTSDTLCRISWPVFHLITR